MAHFAAVKIDKHLNLEIDSVDSSAGQNSFIKVRAQLSRIAAQQLADALLEYAGVAHKASDRRDETMLPAYDRTERPKAVSTKVIRLGTSKPKR